MKEQTTPGTTQHPQAVYRANRAALDPNQYRSKTLIIGDYSGEISSDFNTPSLRANLTAIREMLASRDATLIAGGRNRSIRVALETGQGSLPVLVKNFPRQSAVKDWADLRFRKSKAQRAFEAACLLRANRVVTPQPIAFLQRLQGSRLLESYYLSLFREGVVTLQQALLALLHNGGTGTEFMSLLEPVALECRKMHDAGFSHGDLGNQNILLHPESPRRWIPAGIIDLNRGRVTAGMDLVRRGQDLARLRVPSNLMLMFLDMYWGSPAPEQLIRSFRRQRSRFQRHEWTRPWRHPFREGRIRQAAKARPVTEFFPHPRDIWIWDDTSDQALAALDRTERMRQYPSGRLRRMLLDTLPLVVPLWRDYRRVRASAFSGRVVMTQRIGIALEPDVNSLAGELELLNALGPIPLLLRFGPYQDSATQAMQKRLARQLHQAGYRVTAAFVQDRQAVLEPPKWHAFVLDTLAEIGGSIEAIEFGHAINRVKWGIWSFAELRGFYRCLEPIARAYPHLKILGPATIDFEYPFLVSALKLWPKSVAMSALSHHLYVDRRGAPESPQNGFAALEKFALAKSVARCAAQGTGKVIVSEVNWPLTGTGAQSPVTPPFDYRDKQAASLQDGGVDEDTYACYLVRYLALALCSGLVERVYWWRLVARGYGLVDKSRQGALRQRPGFFALRHFIAVLGEATVQAAEWPRSSRQNQGEYRIAFTRPDGEQLLLCWRHGPPADFPENLTGQRYEDCCGIVLPARPLQLRGSPVYIRHCRQ